MNIFDFFFGIFEEVIQLYNVDFFGFGFTWLEFILGALIIIFVIRFLIKAFFASDSFNFFSLTGLSNSTSMSNRNRENEVVTFIHNRDIDTGHGSSTKRTVTVRDGVTYVNNESVRY